MVDICNGAASESKVRVVRVVVRCGTTTAVVTTE